VINNHGNDCNVQHGGRDHGSDHSGQCDGIYRGDDQSVRYDRSDHDNDSALMVVSRHAW